MSMTYPEMIDLSKNLIRKLSNDELLQQTSTLVTEERRLGIAILNRIDEISRRKLHLELGYSSMFTFLVEFHKYSEATAFRMVNATQVIQEIPEVKAKIETGDLSLTNVAQVQAFVNAQKRENKINIGLAEKRQILKAVEGTSKRSCEKFLSSLRPDLPLKSSQEKVRVLASGLTEVRFVMNDGLMKKLERVRELTAHQQFNPSYAELVEMLADIALEKLDPVQKAERISRRKAEVTSPQKDLSQAGAREEALGRTPDQQPASARLPVSLSPVKASRYIAASVRRQVWINAQSQCTYFDPTRRRRCTERKGLQIDHLDPWARGGSNQLENLTLTCASHNRYRGLLEFGGFEALGDPNPS